MLDDFMVYALLAGFGVALAAGPLGCFIVWRRMAYFGDATSHAAILGVALSLGLGAPIIVGILITAVVMAVLVAGRGSTELAMDTTLGVAAHASLAIGLCAVSLLPGRPLDLEAYLFGDILALSGPDVILIWAGAALVLGVLVWRWRGMLVSTLNQDLASAEGLNPDRERLILALMLAVLVALSIKVIGALLITAMLIIPAAAARSITGTPERMALTAVGLGMIAVYGGLSASFWLDTPAGPSIVSIATVIFSLIQGARILSR